MIESQSLTDLAVDLLSRASRASSGRAAETVHGGPDTHMRQTLMALLEGHGLADHASPGEATLQVLQGRVRLATSEEEWTGGPGDQVLIPAAVHNLTAVHDAVVLLVVAR